MSSEELVYVDESGMNDNDFYPYVYGPVGKRHYESQPGHYKKRLSMIAGLCKDKLQSPFIFDGHCDTKLFELYLEKVLLKDLKPGKTIVIDNASFHKSKKIEKLISDAGCRLKYLPAYSPDLNPIEHYWHKVKTIIRKLRRDTGESLAEAMSTALKKVTL